MTTEEKGKIDGPNGRLSFRRIAGGAPSLVWLGGFRSDMSGTKAEALANWAAGAGKAFLRFDYSGHGESEGDFVDGTISNWLEDARAAIETLTSGPLILVGSSMGGWIAALIALAMRERMAGLVFIAPAPDFTEELIWNSMNRAAQEELMLEGRLFEESPYSDEPTIITRKLIEDGRNHLILGGTIAISCPVRILQGMADNEVSWRHALRFADRLATNDLEMTLIKAGDHRLSKPHEIKRIIASIESLTAP